MDEDYNAYLQGWFDRLAPRYDLLERLLYRVRPVVVDTAAPRNGSRILDAATGTGNQALAFAAMGYEVVAIDLSREMIKVAQRKNQYRNARFLVADAAAMPFSENSFDISSVSFALHDMPRPMREAVLKEMVRVTVPGGTIVVVDYELPQGRIHRYFIRYVTPLYENKYVPEYFRYDLEGNLETLGVEIEEKLPILRGMGKILKGLNRKRV